MERIGIIDLGSNTARLVVFDYEPGQWFRLTDEIRERVRLGEGLGKDGNLTGDAMRRAIAALDLFSDYAASAGVSDIEVIATSAVRDATNRGELLERIQSLGYNVESLSGEEEAGLGVVAVANGFRLDDAWVMDLGGGSAQISKMESRIFTTGTAFPLGAVRLTEGYLHSDPPKSKEVRALEKRVSLELGATLEALVKDDVPLVAMGGTVRNLARAAQKRGGYPVDLMHGYFLRRADLEAVTETLLELPATRRAEVAGISGDRADIILAGALVFRRLLCKSKRDGLWISGNGVREGAFYKRFLPEPHLVPDVRRFSVENLAHHYAQPPAHLDRVRFLAGRVLDELRPLHDLGPVAAELLDAAAVLHDVGMSVGYHLHHKHGAYLVLSARLNGFGHREQALLSLLVRYHRKGQPKLGPVEGLMRKGDLELLEKLAFCLRLAEMLERSRAGRVEDVRVEISKKVVRLEVVAVEEPVVEIWEASKQEPLFERVFGRSLELCWVERKGTRSESC